MMEDKDLFQELKSGVRYAAETLGSAGKTVYKRSKLAVEEADVRRELRDTLARLGRLYVDLRTGGADDLSPVDELVDKVEALDEKLYQIKAKKESEKKTKDCPFCGRKNEKDASFCSGCGGAL
ncbi:MAG: hypothetical protein J5849_07605 [Clostridia bacterium]|nr:hypothetical protein [Clostridia bacterium]